MNTKLIKDFGYSSNAPQHSQLPLTPSHLLSLRPFHHASRNPRYPTEEYDVHYALRRNDVLPPPPQHIAWVIAKGGWDAKGTAENSPWDDGYSGSSVT